MCVWGGVVVVEESDNDNQPRTVIAFNSFEFQRGGRKEKKISTHPQLAVSTSLRSPLSASSARSLVSFRLSRLSPAPSPSSLPSRQVWAIHSDVRLTPSAFCCESQKDRKKREMERKRDREGGKGAGRKMEKTKKDKLCHSYAGEKKRGE